VKASHNLARVAMTFDDDTLLPNGGLTVAALLAQKLDITGLVDRHVTIDGQAGANGGAKAATVIASALAGGDCIDDVARLRAGASRRVFDDTRAPSTVGIWLRAFGWAAVRQLDRVTRELLARAWAAGLGPDLDAPQTIDIDSTVCETYGLAKQGGEFAYTGVRGYHPLIASLADTGELLHARLRGGNAGSGRGAASFVAETIRRVRDAGATGALTLRADSGFYAGSVVSASRRHGVAFSITAATRSWSTPSATSSTTPGWRTCRRGGSPRTPPGSRWSGSPTTSHAGPRMPPDWAASPPRPCG
jgi:hypothetical protein